jgi:hypothetical protein
VDKLSWETLLVGHVYVKRRASNADINKLMKVIADVFETKAEDVKYDSEFNSIEIQSINWTSHVDEGKCELFTKYALKLDFVEKVDLSLYYLTESDFSIYVDKKEENCYIYDSFEASEKELYAIEDDEQVRNAFAEKFPEIIEVKNRTT